MGPPPLTVECATSYPQVCSPSEVFKLLEYGSKQLQVSATNSNKQSSRRWIFLYLLSYKFVFWFRWLVFLASMLFRKHLPNNVLLFSSLHSHSILTLKSLTTVEDKEEVYVARYILMGYLAKLKAKQCLVNTTTLGHSYQNMPPPLKWRVSNINDISLPYIGWRFVILLVQNDMTKHTLLVQVSLKAIKSTNLYLLWIDACKTREKINHVNQVPTDLSGASRYLRSVPFSVAE